MKQSHDFCLILALLKDILMGYSCQFALMVEYLWRLMGCKLVFQSEIVMGHPKCNLKKEMM